ncbi:glycosyltransferase family 90 protein [Dothistroma septosporum NZE10]|uniref:Glycosyltransferase family 90 protein n=1 Tax=Dothistroma septosporum (strain NZE10 / CBS 128990) TaxID=675120 RepID=N1PE05_DOTSN|nr:glycosyltransferase family 90 protein [Dothistroma septosporum NZE10]
MVWRESQAEDEELLKSHELAEVDAEGGGTELQDIDEPRWMHWSRRTWRSTLEELLERRPTALLLSACIVAIAIAIALTLLYLAWYLRTDADADPALPPWPSGSHPIDALMAQAEIFNSETLTPEHNPRTVADAAAAYRKRRGRHPPPMFDMWFAWAKEHDCLVIENVFDQVHENIEPFWGADAATTRRNAESFSISLSARGGKTEIRRTIPPHVGGWVENRQSMLREIPAGGLPDVDMPINIDDVAHVYTSWEEINRYMKAASLTRGLRPAAEMIQQYTSLPPPIAQTFETFADFASENNVWELARHTCRPNSVARELGQGTDMTTPSAFSEDEQPPHMLSGFVSNWTASKTVCEVPELRSLHGTFVKMVKGSSVSPQGSLDDRMATRQFFPLFSAGKIAGVNNDILIPPATSWGKEFFRNDNTSWNDKRDILFWRGAASGGNNTETTWTHFHRHRFLSAVNGTQYDLQEHAAGASRPVHVPGGQPPLPWNIPIPAGTLYNLVAAPISGTVSSMSSWISSWADAAFTSLVCHWAALSDNKLDWFRHDCPNSSPYYANVSSVPFEYNFAHKYFPDVDGMGYSGRFRAFMDSDSLPIKATIWQEWSATRLVPWKHFVPMDNTFRDIYGLMDYFLGFSGQDEKSWRPGHDQEAKHIADCGRDWARRVLRKEDMASYMWRVVLEYARAVDDRREQLGYVQDLLASL